MATTISSYQSSALAAKLALYTTNQGNGAAGNGEAKAGGGSNGEAAPTTNDKTGDSIVLTLSAAAQQWLASQQAGAQTSQPTSLAAYLSAADNSQPAQTGFIDSYSGAIKQFQQWISQPLQVNVKPKDDHNGVRTTDSKPGDKPAATAKVEPAAETAGTATGTVDATAVNPTADTAGSNTSDNNGTGSKASA